MDILEQVGADLQNFVVGIKSEATAVEDWFKSLFDKPSQAPAPTVSMPSGTTEQQIAQLLLQIANQNASTLSLLTEIRNATAPQNVGQQIYYTGTLSSTYDISGQSYFEFQDTHYQFLPLNDSSTQSMFFSFDGIVDAGEIKVGEYLPFRSFPGFTQIYFKCADTASSVRLWIW